MSLPLLFLIPGLISLKNEIQVNRHLKTFLRKSEAKQLPRLVEVFEESSETLLVFELLAGDLRHSALRLEDLPALLEDVARTLASLHLRGFVHFDIRPDNVLFGPEHPFPGKVDLPPPDGLGFGRENPIASKKWFKKLKLLRQFDFPWRSPGALQKQNSRKGLSFRKQSPRKRMRATRKMHALMEKNYLSSFFQKPSRRTDSRKVFKLADFGLCFNQLLGGMLGFGDSTYLAPELLNSGRGSNFQIDFTKCDIFSLGLTLVKFILTRAGLDSGAAQNLFEAAKRGDASFLEMAVFANVSAQIKGILRKMLLQKPSERLSSLEILGSLGAAIPIISEQELSKVHKAKPLGILKIKGGYGHARSSVSVLEKRAQSALETPEVQHEMFFSKVKESFSFPVLDTSTKAQNVSQTLGCAAKSPQAALKRVSGTQGSLPSNSGSIKSFLKSHSEVLKNLGLTSSKKDAKPPFVVRPKMHDSKFAFEGLLPESLKWTFEPKADAGRMSGLGSAF